MRRAYLSNSKPNYHLLGPADLDLAKNLGFDFSDSPAEELSLQFRRTFSIEMAAVKKPLAIQDRTKPEAKRAPLQDITDLVQNRAHRALTECQSRAHFATKPIRRKGSPQKDGVIQSKIDFVLQIPAGEDPVLCPSSSDDDSDTGLGAEFHDFAKMFTTEAMQRRPPVSMDEIRLRRTEEAKMEGRETTKPFPYLKDVRPCA
jgi:hypothetical protein